MEATWRPRSLDLNPNSPEAMKEWRHWKRTYVNYVEDCKDKIHFLLRVLIVSVSPMLHEFIQNGKDYESAMKKIRRSLHQSAKRNICSITAKYKISEDRESLDDFIQELEKLPKDYGFKSCTVKECGDDDVQDTFISDLTSTSIRHTLLENTSLNLETAYRQASALDITQKNSNAYSASEQIVDILEEDKKKSEDFEDLHCVGSSVAVD
ncbi:uncharacterized protein [Lepeophtheirus salmonis]|uniref:uncharacterized protein n=1 Tax=Lepeophtheirus salmonis TaxID=72036 RepID=UPI003AF3E53E